ncbi:MAG: ABC transporter ATP-binding protein [Bacteroidales bacterium]|jgi:ATP-binding cassette subfamily B protein|nr:ABC transporter ATP-binding protein [Bacteroidales bacterium]
MNYNLNKHTKETKGKRGFLASLRKLMNIIGTERRNLSIAFFAIALNVGLSLLGPYLLGYTIDTHVQTKNYEGVLIFAGILLVIYIVAYILNYIQIRMMGGIGQRLLFRLRNDVFEKLQELPLDFFNQNKAGDLISRINNDTDNLNEFFSHSLMQFIRNLIMMIGAGVFLLSINLKLGLATLSPTLLLLIITISISPWIRSKNKATLKSIGNLSAEIQEGLANFKVIVAFDRRDYFRKRLDDANKENYKKSIHAGIANSLLSPIYTFASNVGELIVLSLGIWLIAQGRFSIGLLISFIAYVSNFYNPLRQLARLWANFQLTLAAWERISQLLSLKSNLPIIESKESPVSSSFIDFQDVSFAYPEGEEVLKNISFELQRGKTYAFVGPTGGGKTTTASLISRLYDVTSGTILLDGKDIRSYTPCERASKIGFILQDPILFTGTVRDNILYGNSDCGALTNEQLEKALEDAQLFSLLKSFDKGLETSIEMSGDSISLGQKQIIAFMRAILRKPEILILDEATANIDTVTEQKLEQILTNLPKSTTKVIIAHRLNTIENADEIFFVNSQKIIAAGSFDEALNLLMQEQGVS